jgi:C4-dicarboxylate-specific signal transduction histidine kinase
MKCIAQKQSPSELDRWRDAAMGMQPMSALGQLTQMVAHDLNNQLQSIVLHLELLRPLGEKDEKVRKHIRRIAEAVEKSEAFVIYLRDVRMKSEKDSEADVKQVVEGIVLLMEGTLRRANLAAKISCDEELPSVGMSMLLVHEVLLNVIMNAVEASENGGVVTIEAAVKGDKVVVDVSDSGKGMSSADSAHVTDPFFTTKGQEHRGLGLTVADATLDEFGGSLSFSTAEGGGTMVEVAFPRATHP